MIILICFIIILICFGISFLAGGLIDKFCKEDELKEQFLKENEEKLDQLSKKEKKEFLKQLKNIKEPFKFRFDFLVFLILSIVEVLLYIFVFNKSIEQFIVYSFINFIITICAFTDVKRCIIPDELNLIGFIVGIIYACIKTFINSSEGFDLILGGFVGFGIFALILLFSLIVFRKEGMGGGDIKLMGVLGLFFGFKSIIQIFILSFLFASVISIFLLVTRIKKKTDYIAFGPFIVLATYITMFISGAYTYNQIYRYMMYNL
ncbi:MAG: prepilin peptidase [Clostridia bacterium]|nr:prepilin peptidase [Clostridia bacterium]